MTLQSSYFRNHLITSLAVIAMNCEQFNYVKRLSSEMAAIFLPSSLMNIMLPTSNAVVTNLSSRNS